MTEGSTLRCSAAATLSTRSIAEQPRVDGGQHRPPVGLPLLEGGGRLQPSELAGVGLGLGQPGGGGGTEGRCDVQLGDGREAGGAQQPAVAAAHGDGSGPGGARPPPRHR
jgi:hypothetical protein